MASRRVELAKQLKLQSGGGSNASGAGIHPSNVQINTSVDDTQKSIDELINAGVAGARCHEQNRNHFQRKKMPLSFFNPRTATNSGGKSRGSSAGHSREGSSDDGGGGRHTLSPTASGFGASASAGGHPLGAGVSSAHLPGGVVHQRQASAPALINYNIVDQQQQSHQMPFVATTSNRTRSIAGSSAALPPVAHFHSKSLNTVTINPQMPPAGLNGPAGSVAGGGVNGAAGCMFSTGAGGSSLVLQCDVYPSAVTGHQLPPIAHQRSVKSCDFDAVGIGASHIQQGFGSGFVGAMDTQLGATPYNSAYHSAGYVAHSHHASHQQIHQPHPAYHAQHSGPLPPTGAVFHTPQRVMTGDVAGDLATGAAVEFYANKPQHHKNVYWMDPRGKSQSLDPISLTAAAESASPLAPGASPCSAITAPGSIASVNSSTTSTSQHQQQQHQQQQFLLQQQHNLEMASCSGNSMDDGLGPLPEGWAMSYDQNGDPYFIDHINKATTWYDPRISREMQEETIKMRHSFLQKNNNSGGGNVNNVVASCSVVGGDEMKQSPGGRPSTGAVSTSPQQQQMMSPQQQQQPQQHGFENLVQQPAANFQTHSGSPGGAMDRIRQLKMERNYMLERRQQLCREGLLDRAVNSQQQQQQAASQTHPQGEPTTSVGFFQQNTGCYDTNEASAINDSAMDVDFQQNPGALHQLDPSSLVPEFSAGDLNPREFDKYLQITDNNRQFGVMR